MEIDATYAKLNTATEYFIPSSVLLALSLLASFSWMLIASFPWELVLDVSRPTKNCMVREQK